MRRVVPYFRYVLDYTATITTIAIKKGSLIVQLFGISFFYILITLQSHFFPYS